MQRSKQSRVESEAFWVLVQTGGSGRRPRPRGSEEGTWWGSGEAHAGPREQEGMSAGGWQSRVSRAAVTGTQRETVGSGGGPSRAVAQSWGAGSEGGEGLPRGSSLAVALAQGAGRSYFIRIFRAMARSSSSRS